MNYVRTAEGFAAAVRAGLGWGMFPEQQAQSASTKRVLRQVGEHHLDVPLFWQCWNIDSALIATVTDALRSAARTLRQVR